MIYLWIKLDRSDPEMNPDLLEGDIVLTDEQQRKAHSGLLYARSRWPKGVIPYTINTYHYSEWKIKYINTNC
jgi:hypothetical protein